MMRDTKMLPVSKESARILNANDTGKSPQQLSPAGSGQSDEKRAEVKYSHHAFKDIDEMREAAEEEARQKAKEEKDSDPNIVTQIGQNAIIAGEVIADVFANAGDKILGPLPD